MSFEYESGRQELKAFDPSIRWRQTAAEKCTHLDVFYEKGNPIECRVDKAEYFDKSYHCSSFCQRKLISLKTY